MSCVEISFLLVHRNCMEILANKLLAWKLLKNYQIFVCWCLPGIFSVYKVNLPNLSVNIFQKYYTEFNILCYWKITRILLLEHKKIKRLIICTVAYAWLSPDILFSLKALAIQKEGLFQWGTLVNRSVLFYFSPFHHTFLWTKVRPLCPNIQPQGTMWMDLVAQVLPLIQVSICPRHRLYLASLCEDMQQEVASYYPPLQLWVKSTEGCNKVNY